MGGEGPRIQRRRGLTANLNGINYYTSSSLSQCSPLSFPPVLFFLHLLLLLLLLLLSFFFSSCSSLSEDATPPLAVERAGRPPGTKIHI